MPAGQDEAVAAEPAGIGRIVPHYLLEQQVRGGREAHRGAGVARARRLHRVHRQHADQVDRPRVGV